MRTYTGAHPHLRWRRYEKSLYYASFYAGFIAFLTEKKYLCAEYYVKMRRILAIMAIAGCVASASAQGLMSHSDSVKMQATYDAYIGALNQLTSLRNSQQLATGAAAPDAYSYQLLTTPTLYSSPLRQAMTLGDMNTQDVELGRVNYINRALARFYVQTPGMVAQTEGQMRAGGSVRNEAPATKTEQAKLADKVSISEVKLEVDDKVEVETRKPNFWKYGGRATAQFTQNYFSSNWFQGGENNYAGNFMLRLTANYDDQNKIKWENTLEANLGFQTSPSDNQRTFRPTSNNLRLTSNFGHKAYKRLYYSLQVMANTPIVNNYQSNTDVLTAAFAGPLDVTVGPGLKYDFSWGKKHKFSGTANLAPVAYSMKYVRLDELIGRYGVCTADNHGKKGTNYVPRVDENNLPVLDENGDQYIDAVQYDLHPGDGSKCNHFRHQFGPFVDIRWKWEIAKNITWDSRLYWFSNFQMTRVEWENTVSLRINKYLTSQLYLYPRYEDSSKKYLNETSHTYWMFKEWLSLGVAYDF